MLPTSFVHLNAIHLPKRTAKIKETILNTNDVWLFFNNIIKMQQILFKETGSFGMFSTTNFNRNTNPETGGLMTKKIQELNVQEFKATKI